MNHKRESGAALIMVLMFALVFSVVGLAFLTLSVYELRGTDYRDRSSSAFFVADGGIEAAKAYLFHDGTWRGGFPAPGMVIGQGACVLAVRDSTYKNKPALALVSSGSIGNATRNVTVLGEVVNAATLLNFYATNQIRLGGNVKIKGLAHADGCIAPAAGAPGSLGTCYTDDQLVALTKPCKDGNCGDQLSHGYQIKPPRAYTEPDSFPRATYYYVKATDVAGPLAEVLDRNGKSLVPPRFIPVTVKAGRYLYSLDPNHLSGPLSYFPLAAGDVGVVVNFAEKVVGHGGLADIDIVNGGTDVACTIINTSFHGVTKADRLNTAMWSGGDVTLKAKSTFLPAIGITMIAHNLKRANADVVLGTANSCGLTYVTGDMLLGNGNAEVNGTVICLGSIELTGNLSATWNNCYFEKAPSWLTSPSSDTSGLFQVLLWKEEPIQ